MRAVFDTNVLISAAIYRKSIPAIALDYIIQNGTLLKSAESIIELTEVLSRSRFDRFVRIDDRIQFIIAIEKCSLLITEIEPMIACRDPKDDQFLSLAVSGNADVIVTGDLDLLCLHPFHGVSILTPQQFVEIYLSK